MTKTVETYFSEGCGRCSLGGTPECKVHRWQCELAALRRIILQCGLTEACKWGVPCYTFKGKNIVLISALKNKCIISFFKGALLHDEYSILTSPGKNSQVDKIIRFDNLEQILKIEEWIKSYIYEAIEVEKAGLIVPKNTPPNLPEELKHTFETVPALKEAFEALPPGKQRGWVLYFSEPKQPQTRTTRIVKSIPKILNGKGLHDKYNS